MKKIETAVLASVLFGLAAGCAPVDPAEIGYGAPRQAVYGTRQRIGVSMVSYAQTEPPTDALAEALRFDESSSCVEVFYALPLGPGSDLKIAIDSRSWWMIFDGLGTYPVEWKQTGIVLLLRGGWTWGRFGAHIGAGPGWVFNNLEGLPNSTTSKGDYALEVECGVSIAIRDNFNLSFDLGYRANSADLTWEDHPTGMNFSSVMAKIGVTCMF